MFASGTWDMYVKADQTSRNDARGQRIIAVEVAGERYLTVFLCISVFPKFTLLYLLCPFFWLIPPALYKMIIPAHQDDIKERKE